MSRLVLAAAVVSLAVACGDGGRTVKGPKAAVDGVVVVDPAAGRLTRHFSDPVLAASDGSVLVAGDFEPVDDETIRVRRDVIIVDAKTGKQRSIAGPSADLPLEILSAAGDQHGSFVVMAARCRNADAAPRDDRVCSPASGSTFRLDPGAGRWSELPFPDEISPARGSRDWNFSGKLHTAPDGQVFALLQASPAVAGPRPTQHLLVLVGDHWRSAGTFERAKAACATNDSFSVLSKPAEGSDSAAVSLTRVARGTDARTTVELPELSVDVNAVGVVLGCDRSRVYLTSASLDVSVGTSIYASAGPGSWTRMKQAAHSLPTNVTSTSAGIAVISDAAGTATADRRIQVVRADSDQAAELGEPLGADYVVPDVASGDLYLIGPIPSLKRTRAGPSPAGRVTILTKKL